MDAYSEKLKKMKEDIIKNFDELSSTDLMQLSKIAREIVDDREKKCIEAGYYSKNYEAEYYSKNYECEDLQMKIFEKREVKNFVGCWNEYYLFGKKIYTKLVHIYKYI